MKQVTAAAIYARISLDQTGEGLGVQRQLEDCRRLAAERGWTVAEEYIDNDISAFSGKTRPRYDLMLRDLAEKRRDAVLVYHLDRLTRRPIELEYFIEVCAAAGVDVTTVTGDVGLGNDNGLMIARITAAMAAAESGRKSARLRRKMQQNAEMGKPNGGALRPFGYEEDKVTVRESEARIIRRLVSRYIAGESMRSLATWMNKRKIPTVGRAKGWSVQTLRPILLGGRIAGIRSHYGQPVAQAVWPAIITMRQHRRVLAAAEARSTGSHVPGELHLLRGFLRCGRCGSTLVHTIPRGLRRYACAAAPGKAACGKLSINAVHIEEWAAGAVLLRIEAPEMAELLAGRASANEGNAPHVAELMAAQRALTDLAELFGAGQMTRAEYLAARAVAEARRSEALRKLDRATDTNALDGLIDTGTTASQAWAQLSVERQREILQALLRHATIQPRPRGVRKLDPTRVEPAWVD